MRFFSFLMLVSFLVFPLVGSTGARRVIEPPAHASEATLEIFESWRAAVQQLREAETQYQLYTGKVKEAKAKLDTIEARARLLSKQYQEALQEDEQSQADDTN